MLDPHSGIVKEYRITDVPGAFPETYEVAVDRNEQRGSRLYELKAI